MNKYLPNDRDFSAKFGLQVIKAQKFLLDLGQVKFVHGVQQYRAISAKRIWKEVQKMGNVNKYFPDFSGSRVPQRAYLLNVVNTVKPDSIKNLVLKLQAQKKEKVEYEPVEISAEYADMLDNFQSIQLNQRFNLQGVSQRVVDLCCICR